MDMSNVKSIYDNSVGKEVKKIQDANGNIIWYKVPDGYREVEYIHGDGEQYINTDYSVTALTEINIKEKSDQVSSGYTTRCILGGRTNAQNGLSIWDRQGYFQYGTSSGTYAVIANALGNTKIHTINIKKGGMLYIDGVVYYVTVGTTFAQNSYLYLFSCLSAAGNYTRPNGVDKRALIGNIYYCIVKDNDILVRHLIPIVRTSDNKPGMYDLVNDVFYTNAGTGEFTWGEISNG